jgi:hypothetical protein
MDFIEQLRQKIDTKHQEAMKALQCLADYLPNGSINGNIQENPLATERKRKRGRVSQRDLVVGAIKNGWASADTICQQSGLSKKQCQGVLNAPDLRENIDRRAGPAGREYRLKEAVGTQGS